MIDNNYNIFRINIDPRVVLIENIGKRFSKHYKLNKGIKVSSLYSPDIILNISSEGGDWITDFIDNISGCIIINDRVKKVFEDEGLGEKEVEYLPFILHDKKGRVLKKQYYIANVLISIPCFDYKRSRYKQSDTSGRILNAPMIEVVKEQIPNDAKLFRISEYPSRIAIRSDFLKRLQDEEFTGISVVPTGEDLI